MEQDPQSARRQEELKNTGGEGPSQSRNHSQDAAEPPLLTNRPSQSSTERSNSYADSVHSTQYTSTTYANGRPSLGDQRTSMASSNNIIVHQSPKTPLGNFAGMSLGGGYGDAQAPVGFDEGILRGLCEMDCSLSLLADRIKQSIASCKQVAAFFRSRAEIEERYARSLVELNRNTGDMYSRADCKAGTFVSAYSQSLKLQDQLAQNRIRFSQRLVEMSDELSSLAREGERLRKQHKDNGTKYQAIVQESESAMDKAKLRFDQTAEELERVLLAKEGESFKESNMHTPASTTQPGAHPGGGKKAFNKAMTKGGMLFKGKGPASMAKQEDETRGRMAMASETFRKAVLESQGLRSEYFSFQLPKILRLLKECADELDLGTQYHLTRYAFLYESTVVGEGTILNPLSGSDETLGLKHIFEAIDNRTDFKQYMQNYAVARGTPRGPRRDAQYEEGYTPSFSPGVLRSTDPSSLYAGTNAPSTSYGNTNGGPSLNNHQSSTSPNPLNALNLPNQNSQGYVTPGIPASTGYTFAVDLGEQLIRDSKEVPKVVEMCTRAIEAYGIESMGIYRLSGTTSKVQSLKKALDTDIDNVDLDSDEWNGDINVISGVLKLWFRELPEPLLTHGLYHPFIEAARYENDRLRHIRLHEQVNELPDPNYATLKFFMGHLDRIRKKESVNQMSISNLSIVFGPTLLGAPPEEGGLNLEHMSFQCKAIETILEKYHEIFVEDDDSGDT